ncbi:MAG: type I methionyl aminopeptidase, partial [Verrucomicrobiota bacterium]
IKPGMSTLELENIAVELIGQTGGNPAFHNYQGFPGKICISLNNEVVYGIGTEERLIQVGDLVSLDIGVEYNGFIGDNAVTVSVGPPRLPEIHRLLEATKESLNAGIEAAKNGKYVGDIGHAVEKVAHAYGFSVVREFVGHGCGCELHEPPEVPNFASTGKGPLLKPGMVLAIEPMLNIGDGGVVVDHNDKWTVRTKDNSLSAHFEHMVLINKKNTEVLTWQKTQ